MGAPSMSDDQAVTIREETQAVSPGALLGALVDLARDPNFDATKFKTMADLQVVMEDRQAERMLTRDLQAIQKALPPVPRNGVISLGQGKGSIPFTTFNDIMKVVQPLCDQYGMTIHFSTKVNGEKLVVTTTLRHPAGASVSSDIPLPIDTGPGRNTTQAHGSSMTYGKRLGVESLFNVIRAGADDDGSKAHLKLLTEEHVTELVELLREQNGDEARFCLFMYPGGEVHTVNEIEEKDFVRAKNILLQAKARKAAAPAAGAAATTKGEKT